MKSQIAHAAWLYGYCISAENEFFKPYANMRMDINVINQAVGMIRDSKFNVVRNLSNAKPRSMERSK